MSVLTYAAFGEKYYVNEELEKGGSVRKKGHLNVQDPCRQLLRNTTKSIKLVGVDHYDKQQDR
jgi:hypothetical protein